jgi:betaine-aldehyde dehydrogenase
MRFARQGQSCTAGSRLFVHRDVFESFIHKVTTRLAALRVGDPLDEESDIGALVSRPQFDRVCEYIEDGLQQRGVRLLLGGMPSDEGDLSGGYYIEPTVIAGVDPSWRVAREEIFGPVLCAFSWDDERRVIEQANDSHYGLAGYVWTQDVGCAIRTAHALEAGWVQVNQGGGQIVGQSYGGFKSSGIGREMSLEGMLEMYTQRKQVSINLEH